MFYDVDTIDVISIKNAGKIELLIISTGKFDDSEEQQNLFLNKINNYIKYLTSDDFKKDYPDISNTWIVVSYNRKPTVILNELFEQVEKLLKKEKINFKLTKRWLF